MINKLIIIILIIIRSLTTERERSKMNLYNEYCINFLNIAIEMLIENRKFKRLMKINVLRDVKLLINGHGKFNGNNFVG